jgi:hypothetical protein
MLDQLSSLRIVATFGSVMGVLYAFPPGNLRTPNAISGVEFTVLFMVPATLAVAAHFMASFGRRTPVPQALTLAAAVCKGAALALGLQGLLTVYQWYVDPSRPHIEPLVVILGLAAGSAETCSRRISALLKRFSKDSQSSETAEGKQ